MDSCDRRIRNRLTAATATQHIPGCPDAHGSMEGRVLPPRRSRESRGEDFSQVAVNWGMVSELLLDVSPATHQLVASLGSLF